MTRYREFSVKMQIIFYVLTLLIAGVCVYIDFKRDDLSPGDATDSKILTHGPVTQNFAGYEVTHSKTTQTRVQ